MLSRRVRLGCLGLVALLLFASDARAAEPTQSDQQRPGWLEPIGLSASFGVAFGQINFARDQEFEGATVSYPNFWSQTYALGLSYTLGRVEVSASAAAMNYVQVDDGLVPKPFEWRGTFLGGRWEQPLLDGALDVSPYLELALPTGRVNRDSRLLTASMVGADLEYQLLDWARVGLGVAWRRNFHASRFDEDSNDTDGTLGLLGGLGGRAYDGPARVKDVVRPSAGRAGPEMLRPEAFELVGKTRDIFNLGASLTVEALDELEFEIAYGYYRFSGYKTTYQLDGLGGEEGSREYARVLHLQSGTVDALYSPSDPWTIGAGIATTAPTTGRDSRSVRFPFWNTEAASENFSKFRLFVMYQY